MTAHRFKEIRSWEPIPTSEITEEYGDDIYDKPGVDDRRRINDLDEELLLDENGEEIPIFDSEGDRIPRREAIESTAHGPCGVLMNLQNIQELFGPGVPEPQYDDDASNDSVEEHRTKVAVYPLGFLRTAGNVQATGPPQCLYPTLKKINASVRKPHRQSQQSQHSPDDDSPYEEYHPPESRAPAVKAIASQFYNLIAHRATPRAGRLDSQQGLVTAALAGAFAQTAKDKKIAYEKQAACNSKLPSRSFHDKIHLDDCPKSCRAEIVYTVDV